MGVNLAIVNGGDTCFGEVLLLQSTATNQLAKLTNWFPLNHNPIEQLVQKVYAAHACCSSPSISATMASMSLRSWSILATVVLSWALI